MIDQYRKDFRKQRTKLDIEYQDVSKLPPDYHVHLITEPSTFNQAMQKNNQNL
jgi:hypothetical protein